MGTSRRPRAVGRLASVTVAAALVAVGVAGCGGSSGPGANPATQDGLKAADRAYLTAQMKGDDQAAYDLLSAGCRAKWTATTWGDQARAAAPAVESRTGVKLAEVKLGETSVTDFTPTSAKASTVLLKPDGSPLFPGSPSSPTPWVYEDGGWHTTGCAATTGKAVG